MGERENKNKKKRKKKRKEKTDTCSHFGYKIPTMASIKDFGCRPRANPETFWRNEQLISEEINSGENYTQSENDNVRGGVDCHDPRN